MHDEQVGNPIHAIMRTSTIRSAQSHSELTRDSAVTIDSVTIDSADS